MEIFYLFSVAIFFQLSGLNGHERFQGLIPNGNKVMNPCTSNTTDIWDKVGHQNLSQVDHQPRSSFGQKFGDIRDKPTAEDQIWTELCSIDSDGDGLTNGEELGDAGCNFPDTNGFTALADGSVTLSHPGLPDNHGGVRGTMSDADKLLYCP